LNWFFINKLFLFGTTFTLCKPIPTVVVVNNAQQPTKTPISVFDHSLPTGKTFRDKISRTSCYINYARSHGRTKFWTHYGSV